MHISKHTDKRAATLATADLSFRLFGRQCPYHARIQRHAKVIMDLNRDGLHGDAKYLTTTQGFTTWVTDEKTIRVSPSDKPLVKYTVRDRKSSIIILNRSIIIKRQGRKSRRIHETRITESSLDRISNLIAKHGELDEKWPNRWHFPF